MHCIIVSGANNKNNFSFDYIFASSFKDIYSYVWHLRLGHINKGKMYKMHKKDLISYTRNIDIKI